MSNCLELVMKGKGNLCWERSPNSKGNFGPSVASPEFYFSSRRVIKAQWLVKSQSHKREKKKKASTNLLTALRCYCQHFLKRARGPCVYVYLFPAPGSTSKILMDRGVVRGGDQGQQTLGNEGSFENLLPEGRRLKIPFKTHMAAELYLLGSICTFIYLARNSSLWLSSVSPVPFPVAPNPNFA